MRRRGWSIGGETKSRRQLLSPRGWPADKRPFARFAPIQKQEMINRRDDSGVLINRKYFNPEIQECWSRFDFSKKLFRKWYDEE